MHVRALQKANRASTRTIPWWTWRGPSRRAQAGDHGGPCSVESREQITEVAQAVKAAGASILRGGRSSRELRPTRFRAEVRGLELWTPPGKPPVCPWSARSCPRTISRV
jgi:3-deoxy-D-arabino-heptulosonate 7-phosphate (DAHP) synthase